MPGPLKTCEEKRHFFQRTSFSCCMLSHQVPLQSCEETTGDKGSGGGGTETRYACTHINNRTAACCLRNRCGADARPSPPIPPHSSPASHQPSHVSCETEPRVFAFICSGACANALRFKRASAAEHHNYYTWRCFLFFVNRLIDCHCSTSPSYLISS